MDVPTIAGRKLRAIELLVQLEDEMVFAVIESLLTEDADHDWVDALIDQEKRDLSEGLADLKAGNIESMDDFKARVKSNPPRLF